MKGNREKGKDATEQINCAKVTDESVASKPEA
jgi:hypothetical protein